MKVAIVIDQLGRGGAERQALNATLHLARRGCHAELIHYYPLDASYEHAAFTEAKVTHIPKDGSRWGLLCRLRDRFKEGQFDIVHAFKATENIYGCLAGRWAGVPVILGGYRVEYRARGMIRLAHRLLRPLVDGWIVNAQAIADSMIEAIGAKPDKFFILPNGLDPTEFASQLTPAEARRKLGLDPAAPVVTKIARLRPQKNHAMFLAMAAKVLEHRPEVRFLVVGDGPQLAAVQEQACSMGLSNSVLFLGNRSDIPDVLAATDVSVLTSHFEGLANALLESMCAGVPVVTTDYAGVEEVVIDQQEGYIVPRDAAPVMAEKVLRLLDNPDLRKQMGQRGIDTVTRRFSMEAMADKLLSIYETCMSRKGGHTSQTGAGTT